MSNLKYLLLNIWRRFGSIFVNELRTNNRETARQSNREGQREGGTEGQKDRFVSVLLRRYHYYFIYIFTIAYWNFIMVNIRIKNYLWRKRKLVYECNGTIKNDCNITREKLDNFIGDCISSFLSSPSNLPRECRGNGVHEKGKIESNREREKRNKEQVKSSKLEEGNVDVEVLTLHSCEYISIKLLPPIKRRIRIRYVVASEKPTDVYLVDCNGLNDYENDRPSFCCYHKTENRMHHESPIVRVPGAEYYLVIFNGSVESTAVSYEVYFG